MEPLAIPVPAPIVTGLPTAPATTNGRVRVLALGGAFVPRTLAARTLATRGLSVTLTTKPTTAVVRVRIFRGSARKAAAVFVKVTPGTTTVKLRHGAIMNVLSRGGVFRIEMTPGTSRTKLGRATVRRITIRRAPVIEK